MAKCSHCSAPLPKSGIICDYCGTRNNIDLQDVKKYVNLRPHQVRICPICHTHMTTINVGEKLQLFIERCESCYGIFFDVNELETMIEHSVKGSRNVDLLKLAKISENPRYIDILTYRKCPICQKTMQRKNFMKRSGVITDVCFEHGVWLDSGELRHIMEWIKTGGAEKIKDTQEKTTPKFSYSRREGRTKTTTEKYSQRDKNINEALNNFFSNILL